MCTPTSYTPVNNVTSMINHVHVLTRKHFTEVYLVKSLCNVKHHPDPIKYIQKNNNNDKELCVSNFQCTCIYMYHTQVHVLHNYTRFCNHYTEGNTTTAGMRTRLKETDSELHVYIIRQTMIVLIVCVCHPPLQWKDQWTQHSLDENPFSSSTLPS